MPYKKITFEDIEQGLDRKELTLLKKRFLDVNQLRLDRSKQSLTAKQVLFLDLIPLLFHVNHASLPGFVSHRTPSGIEGFKPSQDLLKNAKAIARSFRYNPPLDHKSSIDALFMMGSMGTLGQSVHSDLDIWVCHAPDMSESELDELLKKTDSITAWADKEGIEAHFFLMDAERFRQGTTVHLSEESSGTTQHKLLLDEFYRTAIHLAGKLPLWWFVSSEDEHRYDEIRTILLQRRYLQPKEVIDFGSTLPIPQEEYIGAATWHLYKGIDSPYKSILKLTLLEVYSELKPGELVLSQQFKQLIYDGRIDLDLLDPYVMMYQQIEQYLKERDRKDRLEVLRRCFYFKTNQQLSKNYTSSNRAWQKKIVNQFADDWGWIKPKLQRLDKRRQWKAAEVIKEKNTLFNELVSSYRHLHDFAAQTLELPEKLNQDLIILGRKLYAAYERSAGKVEWINPGISKDVSETKLILQDSVDAEGVRQFYLKTRGEFETEILKSASSAGELLIWAYRNSILQPTTDIECSFSNSLNRQLNALQGSLLSWLPNPNSGVSHQNYLQSPTADSFLFMVNLEQSEESTIVIEQDNDESDPLCYGRKQECLIKDINLAFHNTWDESFCFHYRQNAVNAALLEYLRHLIKINFKLENPESFFCQSSHYRNIILRRLQQLTFNIKQFFFQHRQLAESVFIFPLADGYSCLRLENNMPSAMICQDRHQLFQLLEEPHQGFCKIEFDATEKTLPIAQFTHLLQEESIQVFIHRLHTHIEIFIFDERNSMTFLSQPLTEETFLLRPLHRFFRNIFNRHSISANTVIGFDLYPVEFYQVIASGQHKYRCNQVSIANSLKGLSTINLQVLALADEDQNISYLFRCNEQEFHLRSDDPEMYHQIAEFILSSRKDRTPYPCYITDIDLSQIEGLLDCRQGLQTSHHLQLKRHLEQKLNQALQLYHS